MGKHLWRKKSYVRLEEDDPGCLWALFRILNYHRWRSFKKLLTHKKPKTRTSTRKDKGKRKQRNQISMPEELENMNSASVIWGIFGYGLFSKKSNKARIMTEDSSNSSPDLDQQSDAPTLLSLLKAHPYPKMMNPTPNRLDESKQATETSAAKNSKEDEVGVLEFFRVNQDMFHQMLLDSPTKRPRLVKSGTFPSPNRSRAMTLGRAPSKVEHKHNEVWPVSNNGTEFRRVKSQELGRVSSFNESFVRNGNLFDANGKDIKKHLSKSLRLRNEKDFMLLADHQGRGLSFKSGSDFGGLGHHESVAELHIDENKSGFFLEPGQNNHQEEEVISKMTSAGNCEINYELISLVSTSEACIEDDDTHDNQECPIPKDLLYESKTMPTNENVDDIQPSNDLSAHLDKDIDYYNEDLQYVKYVLDVIGFSSGEAPHPLDPAVFDAIEICCPFEAAKSPILNKETTIDMPSSQRKVLFDLVSEALTSIDEKSNGYYPKALSFSCHIRPMSKHKYRVVKETLEYISECLSWRPELDQTLEFAVTDEISDKRTDWMNLQRHSENLALDLEDLIFDELLDEIVYV